MKKSVTTCDVCSKDYAYSSYTVMGISILKAMDICSLDCIANWARGEVETRERVRRNHAAAVMAETASAS